MGIITQRKESGSEIVITFKHIWIFYYSFFLSILIYFLAPYFLTSTVLLIILLGLSQLLMYLGFGGMIVAVISHLKIQRKYKEGFFVKGHKLSIKNPYTITIKK